MNEFIRVLSYSIFSQLQICCLLLSHSFNCWMCIKMCMNKRERNEKRQHYVYMKQLHPIGNWFSLMDKSLKCFSNVEPYFYSIILSHLCQLCMFSWHSYKHTHIHIFTHMPHIEMRETLRNTCLSMCLPACCLKYTNIIHGHLFRL